MTVTPGIPVAPGDTRTIPTRTVPFPTRLAGYSVIAAVLVPARHGELPHLAEMILRDESRPAMRAHGVVIAAVRDGVWDAGDGIWDCSYTRAIELLTERLAYRV